MSAPTGQVFNGTLPNPTPEFNLSNGKPSIFLFNSEDGAIAGWNNGTVAELPLNNFKKGAVYKGLAIDNGLPGDGTDATLFAANFNSGEVEMYNNSFGLVKSFTDPNVPKGYAPFNLSVINGKLYATFAKQDAAKHDDDPGAGHGFVTVFDLDDTHPMRLISRGELNSPWGLLIAPPTFGPLSGDLLVGNFGDEGSTPMTQRRARSKARCLARMAGFSPSPIFGPSPSATARTAAIPTRSFSPLASKTKNTACSEA